MGIVNENGILSERDYSAFKEKSIRTKFAWQMFAAIGSATFFGLLMETAKAMLAAEAASTPVLAAMTGALFSATGIGFILVGAACVYMAQRFFFESATLDQDFNALKIAAATSKAQATGLAQAQSTPAKVNQITPPGMALQDAQEKAESGTTNWAEKIPAREASESRAPKTKADSWAEEIRLNDTGEQVRIH